MTILGLAELFKTMGCVTMKDMQTPLPPSEVSPSKSDGEWCAMFWIEREK